MIQANELRLGNLVSPVQGVLFEKATKDFVRHLAGKLAHLPILTIKQEYVTVSYSFDDVLYYQDVGFEDIKPIPLTEEILLKCGFEKNVPDIWQSYKKDKFCNKLRLIEHINGDYFQFCWNESSTNLYNLHQFQNLYFALIGKELEVKI
jgi:hypothetical protein